LLLIVAHGSINSQSLLTGDGPMAMVAPPRELFRVVGVFLRAHGIWFRKRSIPMTPNPSQVIVHPEVEFSAFMSIVCAHHREIPEVRAEGCSPKDAAERLAQRLTLTLDNAPSDWRRQMIQQAIDDVRAFTEGECF
jgi:hypothetical protein